MHVYVCAHGGWEGGGEGEWMGMQVGGHVVGEHVVGVQVCRCVGGWSILA